MKLSIRSLAALAASILFVAHGQESAPSSKLKSVDLPGWGAASDPDGDCKFAVDKESLTIQVPGGVAHDLAAEIQTTNAPRVLQPVTGDFTIQVKVEGGYFPGEDSTKEGRYAYNGAALIALIDADNVVTLARAVLQRPGEGPVAYANFEIRVKGELRRFGVTDDRPLKVDGPLYLRLQRKGGKFLATVSEDGTTWDELKTKKVPKEWSNDLQAGLAAISTSKDDFKPRFSEFKVEK